jgi:hypothetical protein
VDWKELQRDLENTFKTDGVIGKNISLIKRSELAYGEYIDSTLRGQYLLSLCFQEYFVETIQYAASYFPQKGGQTIPLGYAETLQWQLSNFRTIRAVDVLFHNGYPLEGFARLRHLKESALFLAAIHSGLTTLQKIRGHIGDILNKKEFTSEDLGTIRNNRKKEQRKVRGLMLGNDSGLSAEHLSELRIWEDLFDEEVHGAGLTRALDLGLSNSITIAPVPKQLSYAMFINRYCEICWMLHRTLPFLQLARSRFDETWMKKWWLLDENFLASEISLEDMGKDLATVLIDFINTKLAFNSSCCFDTPPMVLPKTD